jgi:phenylpropionate dioxygenase-like ring-hydroxylating dioxygenase large terminal subunit
MNRAEEIRTVKKLLSQIESGTTDLINTTETSPTNRYLHGDWEREREVLRKFPSVAAPSSALRNAGDFVTTDGPYAPMLVVRQADGAVRAFLNACRHRGAAVATKPCGHQQAFSCPYHGWTYGMNGQLRKVPDEECFSGAALRDLMELPCVEAHGLVWVTPTPGPQPRIEDWLANVAEDLDSLELGSLRVLDRWTRRDPVHWKLAVEGFLEGYHLSRAHANSISKYFLNNQGVYDRFGPHIRYIMAKRSITELAGTDPSTWRLRDHGLMVHSLFPATFVQTLADHVFIHVMWPSAPGEVCKETWFLIPEDSPQSATYWERNRDLAKAAFDEDFDINRQVQRSLDSGIVDHLLFGRNEQALHWLHEGLADAVAGRLRAPV